MKVASDLIPLSQRKVGSWFDLQQETCWVFKKANRELTPDLC